MSKAVIAKYSVSGENFEILVDSDLAYEYITGKRSDPLSVLEADEVFKDANKGERQNQEKLKKAFNTTDLAKIVDIILKKGNVPITTEQRNKLMEEKKRQIVNEIAKNAINPQTNAPHPPQRIEKAIEEAKVHIDPMKSVEEQIPIVLKAIKAIIPIRIEKIKMEIKVGADGYGKIYQDLVRMGTLVKEEWGNDGSWKAIVEIPAGMQAEFLDMLNKKTHGNIETKIVKG